ncbi:hypothetical protein SRHO_G00076140 [Serrasalmus rhombeus]
MRARPHTRSRVLGRALERGRNAELCAPERSGSRTLKRLKRARCDRNAPSGCRRHQFRVPPRRLFKRADATALTSAARASGRRARDAAAGEDSQTVMMPAQMPDPMVPAGSLPSLSPLAGFPDSTLTEQLKLAEMFSLRGSATPVELIHPSKRPFSLLQSEMADEDERRKRRREKNKVAAARCRNKKKERTDFLQKESERLELLNGELKAQIESLKQERQHLVLMLNLHRPTCIVRTDSIRTPETEQNPLLQQLPDH